MEMDQYMGVKRWRGGGKFVKRFVIEWCVKCPPRPTPGSHSLALYVLATGMPTSCQKQFCY